MEARTMAITKRTQLQRRNRLTILADFLEHDVLPRLDGARFAMHTWGVTTGPSVPHDIEKTSACGFAGCAIGWGFYCSPLVKAGFRKCVIHCPGSQSLYLQWGYGYEFFGISEDQFNHLFLPGDMNRLSGAAGLREVVRRIRIVAAGGTFTPTDTDKHEDEVDEVEVNTTTGDMEVVNAH